ncbi:MAG: hypothetical protein A2927_01810 [Candidatus Komeilibacteria bacterium RIFCSPLOWO2_01_FULL_45_10]|uniref:Glycosyltransferase 2-like domain-containing protein n=1 Tax=Candidatus Komeilibacteria bacterium RIFCSPLOWO2_01_FULL_45_10 TaxID=1798550 RepID=A0A1G2BHP3_9BACT|nr:MAG: hypothetical protein A2927_01810 [Candidatus Komeilibacteria bacterium RIFCSPLOWO2_01_FULL_45_10]
MDLSIIIVSWRVKGLLEQCLESIFNETRNLDFEVLVIDNDSGDGTVEMVENNFPRVKLVKSQINLGFARAANLGLKRAQGRFLLLLNPDTKLIDNSLKKSVDFMEQNPAVGVLGGRLLNRDLTLQPSVRRFPRLLDHLLMALKLHHLFPLKKYLALDFDYNKTGVVEQVMGAFFLISRRCFSQAGFLDEKYYIWFEEVDYCWRAKKAGFTVNYYPEAKIIHLGGQSFRQVFTLKNQWIFSASRLRYIRKHQGLLAYLVILILTPISLLLSLFNLKNGR